MLEKRNEFGYNVLFLDTTMSFMDIKDIFCEHIGSSNQ